MLGAAERSTMLNGRGGWDAREPRGSDAMLECVGVPHLPGGAGGLCGVLDRLCGADVAGASGRREDQESIDRATSVHTSGYWFYSRLLVSDHG